MEAEVRHVPERTCVACRTRRPKADLVRVVRRATGEVILDPTGELEGRGAYLCADPDCWDLALRRSALQRALRTALPETLKTRLEHGHIATGIVTGGAAPETMTGGTHGT